MPQYHGVECFFQRRDVQRPSEPKTHCNVIRRISGIHLVEKPESLLADGRRENKDLVRRFRVIELVRDVNFRVLHRYLYEIRDRFIANFSRETAAICGCNRRSSPPCLPFTAAHSAATVRCCRMSRGVSLIPSLSARALIWNR